MNPIGRRTLLQAFMPAFGALLIGTTTSAEARRRVRFSGRGLPAGARYSGPTLSRSELNSCVRQERSINERFASLEREESELEGAQLRVDSYNRQSVDDFNERVARFNSNGQAANTQVGNFNQLCANRAYYDSDMQAVEKELGVRR